MASGEPARARSVGAHDPSVLLGLVIAERYRVDAVLGVGGMGAVLRCRHLGLDRDVAVKLLHPELVSDAEIAARFDREARSASRLDHPNCVHVFDFGAWQPGNGGPAAKYLAMQLLSGCELTCLLGQPLPPRRAIALMQQILAGLEHAHERGVVHRDLKPENVFVTRDALGAELLKLVDFGIAKITTGDGVGPQLTRVGVVFGTPMYMSPEQAAGGVVDLRADLYTCGVMLFEMLSGSPPFEHDEPMALLRKHLFHDPPALPDTVPPGLKAITLRLLQKERADRYDSAAAVRTALAEVDAELAHAAGDPLALSPTIASSSLGSMRAPVTTVMPAPIDSVRISTPRNVRPLWRRALPWAAGASVVLAIVLARTQPEAVRNESPDASAEAPAWWAGAREAAEPPAAVALELPTLPLPPALDLLDRGVDDAQLAELDALLARAELGEVLVRIDALLLEHPDDAALLLRRARTLERSGGRDAEAIDAFADALAHDHALLDDRDVVAELFALLRRPELRKQATVLASAQLGEHGAVLLLEFVHAPKPVLGWTERHQALAAIEAVPGRGEAIDRPLQLSLDLWQARQAPSPCAAFAETLDAIEHAPDAAVLGSLARAPVPVAAADADEATRGSCAALPARVLAVKAVVLAAHPTPPEQWTVPPAYVPAPKKAKKKRGLLRRLFR